MKIKFLFLYLSCFLILFITGCASVSSTGERGAKIDKVVNAGIAFAGVNGATAQADMQKKYPYISAVRKSTNLNAILTKKLEKSDLNFTLLPVGERLVNANESVASLAFVVNFEKTYIKYRPEFGKYHLRVYVGAQALFFDFKTKTILASFPFMIIDQDLMDRKPTENDIINMYAKIFSDKAYEVDSSLFGGSTNLNIFDYFIERLSDISPKRHYATTIGIGDLKYNAANNEKFNSANIPFASKAEFAEVMANGVNAAIYEEYKVPTVPFSYNSSKLYYQLLQDYEDENGNMINSLAFDAPKSTYKINLNLIRLYRKQISKMSSSIPEHNYFATYDVQLVNTATNQVICTGKIGAASKRGGNAIHEDEFLRCLVKLNGNFAEYIEDKDALEPLVDTIKKCN